LVVRRAGVDSYGVWGRSLGMEGKRTNGKGARKILEVVARGELVNARLYD